MAAKVKMTEIEVQVEVRVSAYKTVKADNLEDALAQARKLTPADIIEVNNVTINDESIKVTGAFLID